MLKKIGIPIFAVLAFIAFLAPAHLMRAPIGPWALRLVRQSTLTRRRTFTRTHIHTIPMFMDTIHTDATIIPLPTTVTRTTVATIVVSTGAVDMSASSIVGSGTVASVTGVDSAVKTTS